MRSADGKQTTTDAVGRFVLPCVPSASATITAQTDGFAPAALQCSLERVVLWFCLVLGLGHVGEQLDESHQHYSKARRTLSQS